MISRKSAPAPARRSTSGLLFGAAAFGVRAVEGAEGGLAGLFTDLTAVDEEVGFGSGLQAMQ